MSLAQHAAIRHLVRGYRVGQIARHLGVSRHTIKRWKHDPQFTAELERLRREMTAAIVSPAARATPPPRPLDPLAAFLRLTPPHAGEERSAAAGPTPQDLDDDNDDDATDDMTDAEFAETEAWVESVIRAHRAGQKIPPPPPSEAQL